MSLKRVKLVFLLFSYMLFPDHLSAQNIKRDTITVIKANDETILIDIKGNRISKIGYEQISMVSGLNYFLIQRNNRVGVINNKGENILPAVFKKIYINNDLFIC